MTNESKTEPQRTGSRRVLRVVVVIALLIFVFGWLLPRFIDYELIGEAISGLTWFDLVLLLTLSALRVPTEAMLYRAMLPGLRLAAGSGAYLSSNAAANFMPPPAPTVIQYAYFRSEGFANQPSLTGAVGSFIFPQGARVALPVVALAVLLIAGQADTEAFLITLGSLVLLTIIGILIRLIGRSETSARWVGAWLGRVASWVMSKLGREPVGDLGDQVVQFRNTAYAVVRERWPFGLLAVTLNLGLTYVILIVSLRSVGIESSDIGLANTFASFAVAFFAGVVIPITGSGLGLVDIVMVSALSASAVGTIDVNVIVAAVVIWRLFYGLLAFIPGVVTLSRFSRENRDLLGDAASALGADDDPEDPM
ncbi:MAG: lysylphosphatidylglycerol synthase domain-containing protein [Acidimicrobiales bacterium]